MPTLQTLPAARVPDEPDPRRIRGDLLRRSLKYTLLAWIPGAFWQGATGNTTMTPLGQFLGANDLVFSLITQVAPMLASLLMIPGSLVVQHLGRRKGFFIWTVTPHRTLYILIGLLPWFMPAGSMTSAMLLVLLVFLSMGLNSFGGQAWVNWMADLVPPRVRGTYFARRSRMGVGVIAMATVLVALILDCADRPWLVAILAPIREGTGLPPLIVLVSTVFVIAGAVGMLDILSFVKVAEPAMTRAPQEPLATRLLRPLRDGQFRRFLAYWSMWNIANSWCSWFWMLYLLDFLQHNMVGRWWGGYIYLTAALVQPVAFQIGQFLGYPMWGRAVDRFGRKPVFLVSSALHTLTWLAWIFLSPSLLPWLLPIQIVGGIVGGGMDIASFNMMLLFNRRGGPGYQAVGTVVFSTAAALSALTAGVVGTMLTGFHWTFAPGTPWEHTFNRFAILILAGSSFKYLADFVFLARVHDVDSKPAGHALRFVLNNLHGTVNTLIFVPLRTGMESVMRKGKGGEE